MKLFAILLVVCGSVFGAEADLELPEETAFKQLEAQAKAEYDRKVDAAKAKLLAALERYKKDAMQKGNLELALLVDKKIKSFGAVDQDQNQIIVGKWKVATLGQRPISSHVFLGNGTGYSEKDKNTTFTWRKKEDRYLVTWDKESDLLGHPKTDERTIVNGNMSIVDEKGGKYQGTKTE